MKKVSEYKISDRLESGISEEEIRIADRSIDMALEAGASAVQVTLDKARTEVYALLDGEIDNIRQTGDRALTFRIYADGRYGVFSTNRLEENSLRQFLRQAVENVRLLAPDKFRRLPDADECAADAIHGDETGLCWYGYDSVPQEDKIETARRVSVSLEYSVTAEAKCGNSDAETGTGRGHIEKYSRQSAEKNGSRTGVDGDNLKSDGPSEAHKKARKWQTSPDGRKWRLVSEEVEYNSTLTDTYLTNSDRIHCRQTETSFEVCSQVTIEDTAGNKYSGIWWDCSISPEKPMASDCGHKAIGQAVKQIAPVNANSGKYVMVVSNRISGRLLQPVLNALGGRAIQQKSSFLTGTLDQKIFSEGLTVIDLPREAGKCGAIFFEPDGRATQDMEIITGGVVKEYFISVYMSGKLDMPATSECANRPVLQPWLSPELAKTAGLADEHTEDSGLCDGTDERQTVSQDRRFVHCVGKADRPESSGQENAGTGHIGEAEILQLCGSGILVTDFNGGNCNSATGDFSYGIEGLMFEGGKITRPVSNMLITGNMITLWNNLIAAGTDPLDGFSRQVPTIAFKDVDFSA